ncbi:hypothetical protein [Saccharothrix luteola]|uniref:hypothetical protein n=1 Tax=Saccharothrix luteola TaxID=2893018 RepID=UPI001E30D83B|nr:hypothetical protein [Saccharothrix luteola]MCC8250523.1 hypothetical protein [Saccharothrix luteola]
MSAPTLEPQRDVMGEIETALNSIDGMSSFSGAARGFVKGEISLDDAVNTMMAFFEGDISGRSDERKRLIQLAQTLEAKCGTISLTVSVASCTAVTSCSPCC